MIIYIIIIVFRSAVCTIGKVAIVPKHWQGWTANQHNLSVVPSNKNIAGYIYAWLATDYGKG